MLGSNLLDAIPCNVKAVQTATKAEYISNDVGCYHGILKIQGLKFGILWQAYAKGLCSHLRVYWQASDRQNVIEKIGTDKCTWQYAVLAHMPHSVEAA